MPQIGDTFNIITSGSRTGTFKQINPFTINGLLDWDVNYTSAGAQLTVIEGPGGLRLAMTDNNDPLPLFHELTYTLKVFNAGTETATNIVVTDTLPSTALFASAVLSHGSFTENEGTVTCFLGDIAPMESATINITVVPTFVSTIQNTATMTTDTAGIEEKTASISTSITKLPGDYDINDSPIDLGITEITPSVYGNAANSVITFSGIGFDNQTTVSLIGPDGTEYFPELAEPDSLFQMTVVFDLSGLPVGRYNVKISDGTETRILDNAFEVYETQKPELETRLVLPNALGRHGAATIYVEYKNVGNVSMPAPMLILQSADEDGSDKPFLTLDASKVIQNLWSHTMPEGVSHSVRFLADGDGDSPGILMPGETGRMPVYYTGLQRPWDFSDRNVELEIRIVDADDDTPFGWEDRKESMKPDTMDAQAWDIVFSNLVNNMGETWGDYIFALSENATYLYRHFNEKTNDMEALFRFELMQAMGIATPVPQLVSSTDMAIEAPGLPLVFSRSFSSSIIGRFQDSPMGKGWTHSWQIKLEEDEEGNVSIASGSSARSYRLDMRGGYFSTPGDYAKLTKSGDIFTLTYPNGIIQRFTQEGRLDYIEDLNGNRITAEYNMAGQLDRLVHSSGQYMAFSWSGNNLTGITDHTGQLTVDFEYDPAGGQLLSATDILDRTTYYIYDGSSAMSTIVRPDATETGFSYDDSGRLSSILFNGIPKINLVYDSTGKVEMINPADNGVYSYYFDSKGRPGKLIDPLGNITSSSFDLQNNLVGMRTPDGFYTSLTYDGKGNPTGVIDPMDQKIQMRYDNHSRMTSFNDARENLSTFSYDLQGNNESIIYPDLTHEDYTYDAQGNLTQKTNRRGNTTYYSHNDNGFVTDKTSDTESASYTYDDVGNIESVTDATGITTMTYYPNHLLQRIDYPSGLFLEYTYDDLGRRTSMTGPDGQELLYAYNDNGQIESITQTGKGLIVRYAYDDQQRLKTKTLGNGVVSSYDYDLSGRLDRLVNYGSEGNVLSRFDYQYDKMGRRISMDTLHGSWSYIYDATGRLLTAVFASSDPEIESKDISYTYDAAGNRVQQTQDGEVVSYATNNMNQYTQAGNAVFEYDDDGNMISKTIDADTWLYTYNDDNRLIAVSGPEGQTEYQYDGLGNLTATIKDGTVTHYLIDPSGYGNVVGEYDETGNLISWYNHGMGLISKDDYYYTFDGNGNTSGMTDTGSAKINSYAYTPFGDMLYRTQTVENDYQFVGQFGIKKAAGELSFMRNRFYMPSVGRFINEDPIGLSGGVNLYAYCLNDPVNFVDLDGLKMTKVKWLSDLWDRSQEANTAWTFKDMYKKFKEGIASAKKDPKKGFEIIEGLVNLLVNRVPFTDITKGKGSAELLIDTIEKRKKQIEEICEY